MSITYAFCHIRYSRIEMLWVVEFHAQKPKFVQLSNFFFHEPHKSTLKFGLIFTCWHHKINNEIGIFNTQSLQVLNKKITNQLPWKNLLETPRPYWRAYCHQIDVKAITYLRRKNREILSTNNLIFLTYRNLWYDGEKT